MDWRRDMLVSIVALSIAGLAFLYWGLPLAWPGFHAVVRRSHAGAGKATLTAGGVFDRRRVYLWELADRRKGGSVTVDVYDATRKRAPGRGVKQATLRRLVILVVGL